MTLKEIQFSKMHGIGNDYILIDETKGEIIPEEEKNGVSLKLCMRRFSVGADGVIFISPSQVADIRFRIFNSDGSEAEMCGNGIRCFSKYVYDKCIVKKDILDVETLGGIKRVSLTIKNDEVFSARVDMGTATFKPAEIPMVSQKEEAFKEELSIAGKIYNVNAVSVGNPHAIIFAENLDEVSLSEIGPLIETHVAFPQKTNVHFVKVLNKNSVR